MTDKVMIISLTQAEQMRLAAVVVDKDKQEALRFPYEVVKRKVDAAQKMHCRPPNI